MTLPTNPAEQLKYGVGALTAGGREKDEMMNLLEETLTVIRGKGHSPGDVSHVQWDGGWCRWHHFEPVAARITYHRGYGAEFVKSSLMVVGITGWWLERHEYDGSEWWEYKAPHGVPVGGPKVPTPDDLLNEYRGIRDTDVVVAEDIPMAAAVDVTEVPLVPAPGTPVDAIQAAWARITHTDLFRETKPQLEVTWQEGGSYLVRATNEGLAAQGLIRPEHMARTDDMEAKLRRVYGDLLQKQSHRHLRNLLSDDDLAAAAVAEAAAQLSKEQAGKVFVPPEDVPHIKAHFDSVLERAGVSARWANDEVVDLTRHVFEGEAEVDRQDGGQALVYTVRPGSVNSASEHLFVRVQSWDEGCEHKDLKALGTRLRVTVERLPEE